MEDDDEFGDLYTDVLRPFSSSSAAPPPHQSSSNPAPFTPSIDLNAQSDDEDFLYVAPKSNSAISHQNVNQPRVPGPQKPLTELDAARSRDSGPNFGGGGGVLVEQGLGKGGDFAGGSKNWAAGSLELGGSRVLESGDVRLPDGASGDDKSGLDFVRGGGGDKDAAFMEKDVNFDIEEVDGEDGGDVGLDPIIPGLSAAPTIPSPDAPVESQEKPNVGTRDDASVQGDDWDSDSEDDLQIVLNDNNHGAMATERNGVMGSDDEDEDGDALVIVADGDQTHPPVEEPEWGEDTAADGDRKEGADAAKVNGAIAGPPKIGYSSHGYHPFPSHFKVSYIYAA